MAAPRVFISSTYYDLKHVRNDIGDFIKGLGYTPVMHDKGGVAYTQTDTLENSCYNELIGCDIVICIIGNHFGSQAADSNFSITMEELRAAIKNKKKIYIFIAKDVYIENKTYIQNKDSGKFRPAYADDIKIHQFIEELKLLFSPSRASRISSPCWRRKSSGRISSPSISARLNGGMSSPRMPER